MSVITVNLREPTVASPKVINAKSGLSSVVPLTRDTSTLGDRVYNELCELLISGKVSPGEKLSVRAIAMSLGVSMMPVRDAIARLTPDRALEVSPYKAIQVPTMTRAKLAEITIIRKAIEGFAAEQAALRGTPEDLAVIQRFDEEFRRLSKAPKSHVDHLLKANKEFHFAVYRAAQLADLISFIRVLWLKIGPVIKLDLSTPRARIAQNGPERYHGELLDALRRGDPERARRALVADIETSSAFIISGLEE